MITIYAFGKVIEPVHGITRDLRALWAAEELVFAAYQQRLAA